MSVRGLMRRVPWSHTLPALCRCPDGPERTYGRLGDCEFGEDIEELGGGLDRTRWACSCGRCGQWFRPTHCVYHAWRYHALRNRACVSGT